MVLSTEQLEAIVARALPGERLRDWRALARDRYALALAGGERLCAQLYTSPAEAAAAAEALRLLRGEVDLPIPQLRASDPDGETVGVPYLLTSEADGESLAQAAARIAEEQLYGLGRRLGEVVQRVHRLACPRYGALGEQEPGAGGDERGYVLARLECDAQRCGELGLLDREAADAIVAWFEREFKPAGRKPALLHGGLGPGQILVRQSESGWRISALLGWGHALGWSPAWDHVTFLEAAGGARLFSLRVGYGNGYDEQTHRAYEQVREHALLPYRLLLALRQVRDAASGGDLAEAARRRDVLRGLVRTVGV
jgi:aminoglycoside phosphotransferase (APT) family kinase protein